VDHLSQWHSFDANDRSTYPKTSSAIQVKYAGGLASGLYVRFFSNAYGAEISHQRLTIHQNFPFQIARGSGRGFSTTG
jgi:hypothetical protein